MLFYNFALIFVIQDQWKNIDDNASGHMKTDMGQEMTEIQQSMT